MPNPDKPLTASEKRTTEAAFTAIELAIDTSGRRLSKLFQQAYKTSVMEFESGPIGKWHVIEGFVRGHRGEISLGQLHREADGYMTAAIVGAGFADDKPHIDLTHVYDLAEQVQDVRKAWRHR